jgi:hypothetical protein
VIVEAANRIDGTCDCGWRRRGTNIVAPIVALEQAMEARFAIIEDLGRVYVAADPKDEDCR